LAETRSRSSTGSWRRIAERVSCHSARFCRRFSMRKNGDVFFMTLIAGSTPSRMARRIVRPKFGVTAWPSAAAERKFRRARLLRFHPGRPGRVVERQRDAAGTHHPGGGCARAFLDVLTGWFVARCSRRSSCCPARGRLSPSAPLDCTTARLAFRANQAAAATRRRIQIF